MTAKEYLGQVRSIVANLKSLSRQVQSLEETLTGTTASVTDMPGAATPNVSRMEMLIAHKIDLEQKIDEQSTTLAEILNTINSLPNYVHTALITARYVTRMDWRDIAHELRISQDRVYQLHREALAETEKIICNYS